MIVITVNISSKIDRSINIKTNLIDYRKTETRHHDLTTRRGLRQIIANITRSRLKQVITANVSSRMVQARSLRYSTQATLF